MNRYYGGYPDTSCFMKSHKEQPMFPCDIHKHANWMQISDTGCAIWHWGL